MDLHLMGKQALISGGSRGIGLACARTLAEEGCRVVLVSRDDENLARAAKLLDDEGAPGVVTYAADLTEEAERDELARRFPDIDILVNNAGAIAHGDLGSIELADWRVGWELKVFGYVHLTKLYLDQMRKRGAGVIVNVIGLAGRSPRADYVSGAAGNASLIAFTEAVGGQSPDFGVRVLGVNPGYTATERFLGRAVSEGEEPDAAQLAAEFPTSRILAPSAIADVVTFLASDRAAGLSGVVVDADLGQFRSGPTKPTPTTQA